MMLRRRIVVNGAGLDQGLGHGHEQRRRYALARDVADAETKPFPVEEIEIIEIATRLPWPAAESHRISNSP